MSRSEKTRARGEQVKGTLKESAGSATGEGRLTGRDGAEKKRGHAPSAKERIKGTFRR
ncbi:CsbD family protein [Streptomyces sp. NPDC046374]|uniref:CsbD family protein n=1 Tax=Streptomyces sp. NPDC046374 TaxID=3154917 RepID=UPI0033CF6421